MQTLYEISGLTISYDAANRCMIAHWYGRNDSQAKKAACEKMLGLICSTGGTSILVDTSQDLDGWHDAIRWLATEYAEAVAANGVQAVAWVLPDSLKTRIDIDELFASYFIGKSAPRLAMDTFGDAEAALRWLRHVVVSNNP